MGICTGKVHKVPLNSSFAQFLAKFGNTAPSGRICNVGLFKIGKYTVLRGKYLMETKPR